MKRLRFFLFIIIFQTLMYEKKCDFDRFCFFGYFVIKQKKSSETCLYANASSSNQMKINMYMCSLYLIVLLMSLISTFSISWKY